MSVQPIAAGGFSAAGSASTRRRPTYARAVLGALLDAIRHLPVPPRVLDVGAGTGILTGALRRAGLDCVAVEHRPAMVRQLRLALPDVAVARAAADRLPVADRSVDVCTAGQSLFHSADPAGPLGEIARVLEPGGCLLFIRDERDETVPWVAELADLVQQHVGAPADDRGGGGGPERVIAATGRFTDVEQQRAPNPVRVDADTVVDRLRTSSRVAAMDEPARRELLGSAWELLSAHGLDGPFDDPHETVLYQCRTRC